MSKLPNYYDPTEFEKLDLGNHCVHRQAEKDIDYESQVGF